MWSAQQEAIHRVSVGPDIIQQKTEVAMPDKTIDVIIPVYRPGKELRELLIRLTKQTVKPSKILLMNTEKEFFDDIRNSLKEAVKQVAVFQKEMPKGLVDREDKMSVCTID